MDLKGDYMKLNFSRILALAVNATLLFSAQSGRSSELQQSKWEDTCSSWKPKFRVPQELTVHKSLCFKVQQGMVHAMDFQAKGKKEKGTVFAIHGNASWSLLFHKSAELLQAEGYRVIAVDLLGFGLSNKPNQRVFDYSIASQSRVVQEVVSQLKLKNYYLLLHDWGNAIGFDLATQNPENVKGIISTTGFAWPFEKHEKQFHAFIERGEDALKNHDKYLYKFPHFTGQGWAKRLYSEDDPRYEQLSKVGSAPFVNPKTGKLWSQNVGYPILKFAQEVETALPFMRDLQAKLTSIHKIPLSVILGDDTAFGPLKCNLKKGESLCPENYTCEGEKPYNMHSNCVDKKGKTTWPLADRFEEVWEENSLVGIYRLHGVGHWLPLEAPYTIVSSLKIMEKNKKP